MARTGIYFSDVVRARDALVAAGRHPSIDAVRAALGNTGSKTTIHKYLREIEVQSQARLPESEHRVSDAIGALVAQLADQLKHEAGLAVDAIRSQMEQQQAEHALAHEHAGAQLAGVQQAFDAATRQLSAARQELAALKEQLGEEQIARHTAQQRSSDLAERLADARRHQASLEEKHEHARAALEEARVSAKQEREQERERHDQQVQLLQAQLREAQLAAAAKGEEANRASREAAAFASELAASRQALHLQRESAHGLERKLEQLQLVESRVIVLGAQLAESRTRALDAQQAASRAAELCNELRQQKAMLEAELARAHSATALELRLAKLDQAVFGSEEGVPAGTLPAAPAAP